MAGACGTCTACCKVFAIMELAKPAGSWCQHCDVGVGCKIYDKRPEVCNDFACLWLQSQSRDSKLIDELRPDKCKIVFSPTTNPRIISAITATGSHDAWRHGPANELIRKITADGMAVVAGPPAALRKKFITMDQFGALVERDTALTKPDENGMQWEEDVQP